MGMAKMKRFLGGLVICHFLFGFSICYGDESEIFQYAVDPDALIVLDLTGSMNWDPAGNDCFTPGCKRLDMAKEAIRRILDDDNNGAINTADENSLGVRIGYMRFYNCSADDTGGNYSSDCNSLGKAIGTSYSEIWTAVNGESATGGTPLVAALNEAKLYLDAHKASDSAKDCRQKFVILITDGSDTYACGGNGSEGQADQYKRRKATLYRAKLLKDAGYKVLVVGFGAGMPDDLKNTLNWAAYFGGTDNPAAVNSGNTSAITTTSNACSEGSSNDPGVNYLSGYAFLATNADELVQALKQAFRIISESRVSFTITSVASARFAADHFLYEASLRPKNNEPFWQGHLKKYNIHTDGTIGSLEWDAGEVLQSKQASSRNIFTYIRGSTYSFTTGMTPPAESKQYLNVSTSAEANAIINYIRGEPGSNPDNWKLGDIFHCSPIAAGSPSPFFNDVLSPNAFATFRQNNSTRAKVIVVGSNDGQFRAFRGSDGDEQWSFIPPNLLPKLKYIAHPSHPTSLTHQFFVDGAVTVADVWLGTGDGRAKTADQWKTLLVFAEGKGVRDSSDSSAAFLWSNSQYCDENFSYQYSSQYPYYCGYYAFDLTNTSATTPTFLWRINPNSTQAQYLDEPWSRMAIGRVKIGGDEKWVGFIGGGYNNDGHANRGKGFFVVDLSNGNILWSYTRGDNPTSMSYSIPASPVVVDTDNDGFVDTAYVGDLGGNVWRFKFCTRGDGPSCSTPSWVGGLLFQASSAAPIYTTPAVARGSGGSIWVFWGTGNKNNPTATGTQDRFFGLKDDHASTYTINQLENNTNSVFSGTNRGWYINHASGEKVLADSSVFGSIVTWTTYTPSSSSNPCIQAGEGKLYAVAMMPVAIDSVTYQVGAGVLAPSTGAEVGSRSISLGTGIVKMPIFSQKPGGTGGTDFFVTISGGGGTDTSILSSSILGVSPFKSRLQTTAPSSQVLHWRDGRLQ